MVDTDEPLDRLLCNFQHWLILTTMNNGGGTVPNLCLSHIDTKFVKANSASRVSLLAVSYFIADARKYFTCVRYVIAYVLKRSYYRWRLKVQYRKMEIKSKKLCSRVEKGCDPVNDTRSWFGLAEMVSTARKRSCKKVTPLWTTVRAEWRVLFEWEW